MLLEEGLALVLRLEQEYSLLSLDPISDLCRGGPVQATEADMRAAARGAFLASGANESMGKADLLPSGGKVGNLPRWVAGT